MVVSRRFEKNMSYRIVVNPQYIIILTVVHTKHATYPNINDL